MADALTAHLAALDNMLERITELTADANRCARPWNGEERRAVDNG